MSTADLAQVLQTPGRLCISPTSLSGSFPYGGTSLGSVREIRVARTSGYYDVSAEELGGQVVESVWSGENYALGCYLRQWDETALGTVFENTLTTGTSKHVAVKHWMDASGGTEPGGLLSARSVKLLFVPDDTDRNRSVIFYRALPRLAEVTEILMNVRNRVEFPAVFLAIPDATSRVCRIDFLRDLAV
jgi:hypothetical protein